MRKREIEAVPEAPACARGHAKRVVARPPPDVCDRQLAFGDVCRVGEPRDCCALPVRCDGRAA